MMKKILLLLFLGLFFFTNTPQAFAAKAPGDTCDPSTPASSDCGNGPDGSAYSCQRSQDPKTPNLYLCQPSVFGKIQPPDPLKNLVSKDPTGAAGLSSFFSNLITLIYSLAAVVLVFMIVWGAFDWIMSEGDKEKIKAAQQKIVNAIIGIILFAVAFAVISVLGTFTGFRFFAGQGGSFSSTVPGKYTYHCPGNTTVTVDNPDMNSACAPYKNLAP